MAMFIAPFNSFFFFSFLSSLPLLCLCEAAQSHVSASQSPHSTRTGYQLLLLLLLLFFFSKGKNTQTQVVLFTVDGCLPWETHQCLLIAVQTKKREKNLSFLKITLTFSR